MAPTSNPAKVLQQNRPRPAVTRMVVPAIPLPYVQKRQRQQAAAAVALKNEKQTPKSAVELDDTCLTSPAAVESEEVVNGDYSVPAEEVKEIEQQDSPASSSSPSSPGTQTEDLKVEEQEATVKEAEEQQQEEHNLVTQSVNSDPQDTPKSVQSENQSEGSRTTYQLPPAFVPANIEQPDAINNDSVRFPPPGVPFNGQQHAIHHAHPSVGSMMFGGYPESNNSSPAPPASAGMPPFPPQYLPQFSRSGNGRHGHHLSNGGPQPSPNGFSPMGPPPHPYPRQDGYNNQAHGPGYPQRSSGPMSFGAIEGYSPTTTPLDARFNLAPRSNHGSQSSTPFDQDNGHNSYTPQPAMSNSTNGYVEDPRMYQQSRPTTQRADSRHVPQVLNYPPHLNGQPGPPMDHLDGLVSYLQNQFADPTIADFILELRYTDDRAPPVRIPGHNLIFARSPVLKNLMAHQTHSDGLTVRTLLIESDDRFLRSDGFWMAVQRLYGGPLLDLGILAAVEPSIKNSSAPPPPGSISDRFHVALGYAAAGQILQIPPVISRGVEIASQCIRWDTVEKAFDFGLDGGLDAQWMSPGGSTQDRIVSTYGPAANTILHHALNLVITAFPASFKLDTSVGDTLRNSRLPTISKVRPGPNPRLSFITFGDHPSAEAAKSSTSDYITIVLSKLLLNLPFHLLKYILESTRLGNVQGWATTSLRQEVMHAVIEEREKRRVKVHSSSFPDIDRTMHPREWDPVGWQESVQPFFDGNETTPTLNRNWVDFRSAKGQ